MKTEVQTRADIDVLRRRFYAQAFADELLSPIFTHVARLDLEHHLPLIGDLWETILLGTGSYSRHGHKPLQIHAALHDVSPLAPQHFERWLAPFGAGVDESFQGPNAQFLKTRAAAIASRMQGYMSGVSLL